MATTDDSNISAQVTRLAMEELIKSRDALKEQLAEQKAQLDKVREKNKALVAKYREKVGTPRKRHPKSDTFSDPASIRAMIVAQSSASGSKDMPDAEDAPLPSKKKHKSNKHGDKKVKFSDNKTSSKSSDKKSSKSSGKHGDKKSKRDKPKAIPHCRVCKKPRYEGDHTSCKAKRAAAKNAKARAAAANGSVVATPPAPSLRASVEAISSDSSSSE